MANLDRAMTLRIVPGEWDDNGEWFRGEPLERTVWVGPLDLRYCRELESGANTRSFTENHYKGRLRDFQGLKLSHENTLDGATITDVQELPDSQRRYCRVSVQKEGR